MRANKLRERLRRLLHHVGGLTGCPDTDFLSFPFEVSEDVTRRAEVATNLIAWWDPPCNQFA